MEALGQNLSRIFGVRNEPEWQPVRRLHAQQVQPRCYRSVQIDALKVQQHCAVIVVFQPQETC